MVLQEQGFLHISQRSCSSVASTIDNPAMSVHNPARNVDRKFRPSGHFLRTEPSDVKWMQKFPSTFEKVKEIGWYVTFEKIAKHHIGVTKSFCQSFDGSMIQVVGLEFTVTEECISHAIGFVP